MLHKSTIFLFIQVSIRVSLVLTLQYRGDEYYDELVVGNNDGWQILKGKLKIQNKTDVKDVVLEDSAQIVPKQKYSYEEDETEVEDNKHKWNFKHTRAKKEVRGFDLTKEEMKKFKIWKDGVIPYYIDIVSFGDKVLRDKIRNHLQMVNSATGISFVELEKPPDDEKERWVFFLNRRGLLGCGDHNVKSFTLQGVQRVVLGYDCMSTRGELAEAVMSILGIPAEHNAPDRDQYIQVRMDNIMPDKRYLFEKLGDREWLFHDLDYDFNSVTHYDLHKYSINGRATIMPTHRYEEFKPVTSYSPNDLRKIEMLYAYIAKKSKIETSICEKLFEIDKIDKRDKKSIIPRHKPSRYLGIPNGNSSPSSSSSSDKGEEKEKKKHQKLEGKEDHKLIDYQYKKEPSLAVTWLQASDYDSASEENMQHKYENGQNGGIKAQLVYNPKKTSSLASTWLQISENIQDKHKNVLEGQKMVLNAPARYNGQGKMPSLLLLSDYDSNEDFK